jgi:hypothetical protein
VPDADQTLLLRACLWKGEKNRAAWDSWRAGVTDPIQVLSDNRRWTRTLLPLLMTSLGQSGAQVDGPTFSFLRAAFLRERLRFDTYRAIRRSVLSALEAENVRTVVLKGGAFVETIYDKPEHRHCHDIDLLVHPGGATRIQPILPPLDFSPVSSPEGPQHALFHHSSGLPLRIHTRPFLDNAYVAQVEELFERARSCTFDGASVRILCPEDALVHLCGHASTIPGVDVLRWVCDASYLIERSPDINWEETVDRARAMRVILPFAVRLAYLATELDLPIPSDVCAGLWSQADAASLRFIRAAYRGTLFTGWPGLERSLNTSADWRASVVLWAWARLSPAGI